MSPSNQHLQVRGSFQKLQNDAQKQRRGNWRALADANSSSVPINCLPGLRWYSLLVVISKNWAIPEDIVRKKNCLDKFPFQNQKPHVGSTHWRSLRTFPFHLTVQRIRITKWYVLLWYWFLVNRIKKNKCYEYKGSDGFLSTWLDYF